VKTGNGGGEEPSSEATERFVDVGDGTVTDTQSGLTWTKDANCFDKTTWRESFTACENLASGQCGLNDGSTTGDWRMPNKRELESLVDRSRRFPSLPEGHPLMNIESTYYWTSTDCAWDDRYVWTVHMGLGGGINGKKTNRFCVWCVKDEE
jgi:hypothetical protein